MAKVQFKTKRGRAVTFSTHPGKARKPNAFARYVKTHIGCYLKKGVKPTTAMKKVATDWNARG